MHKKEANVSVLDTLAAHEAWNFTMAPGLVSWAERNGSGGALVAARGVELALRAALTFLLADPDISCRRLVVEIS